MLKRFGRSDLPTTFWYLWLGTLVNRLGGFVVPFLMLYLTARLGMPAQDAALMVSALGIGSFLAQLSGGELADRVGRRPVLLTSFFVTPVAVMALGFVHQTVVIVGAIFIVGFFTNLSRPAIGATVADVVPAERRVRAFGYIYWAINLGAAIAPVVAGLLANFNYELVFIGDAVTTALFGVIVLLRVPETRPDHEAAHERCHASSHASSRVGQVVRDPVLIAFVFLSLIVGMVYAQGEVTLPLAMIANGLTPADYGLALAVNGALIVLVTLHAVRWIERAPRFAVLALSAVLTGIGFGLTQFATALPFYALTVVIWTLGEILAAAIGPALVAELAPTKLRGLYQGVFGASWGQIGRAHV